MAWISIFLGAALKSTVVLGAAWLLTRTLRQRSAATRHLVWTGATAALLALPLLFVSMPKLAVPTGSLAPLVSSITFRTSAVAARDAVQPKSALPNPSLAPIRTRQPIDLRLAIPLLWAVGAALALAQLAAAWMVMWRMRRTARPLIDSPWHRPLAEALQIRRPVALLEIPAGGMPLSFGILSPAVFLPADARQWSDDRRRVVLLHELAHIRRGDLLTQLIARTAVSLFWWNPLAWVAIREFVKERERAADDLVLTAGEPATDYAAHLLEIARSMQATPALAAAVAMARPSQLEGRLVAILDRHIDRQATGPRATLAAAALAIALAAPFAALQAQDNPDATIRPAVDATIRAAIAQQNHDLLDAAASDYAASRKYDTAQELLENSLTIRARTSGENSSAYAEGLLKLGDLSARRGKTADAVDFYKRAVALGNSSQIAPALVYLARQSLETQDLPAAETYIDRALAIAPTGKAAGQALTVKGNIALANGLPGVAELNYLQALAEAPGATPEAALAMETYARFLSAQDRSDEADELRDRATAIRKNLIQKTTSHLPIAGSVARVGGGVSAPVLLRKREPQYSDAARAAKIQGTVTLNVTIGPDGRAHDTVLARGVGFGLDEMAAEAVSDWTFAPGKRDGVPVSVQASIEVNFQLM